MKCKIEKNTVQETLILPLYSRKLCSELYPYHRRTSVGCVNSQNNPHGQGVALTLGRRSKLS